MSEPVITFVIPYYRGREYLRHALGSIRVQQDERWCAIVVDDCGGEDASELVAEFRDDRISYVRNVCNLGLAGNWNKAMSHAQTELVTIMHADDELEPWYVAEMSALMNRHPEATLGHCRTKIIDKRGDSIFSFPDVIKKVIEPKTSHDFVTRGEDGLNSLLRGAWIFCPTICYRKSKFPPEGFSAEWKMVLDLDLMTRLLMSGATFVGSRRVAYRYRRHDENQTALLTKELTRFREEIALLDRIAIGCEGQEWKRAARTARRKTIIRLHLAYEGMRSLVRLRIRSSSRLLCAALRGKLT